MRPVIRIASRILGLLAVVFVVATFVLACYGLMVKLQAETLLKDLTNLQVGKSTEAEAEQFAQRHSRFLVSHDCQDVGCLTTFKVRNTWLSAVRLEPVAEFGVGIGVKNGTVNHIGAFLMRSMPIFPTFSASAGMVDEYDEFLKPERHDSSYNFPTPLGKPYLRIALDSHASPVQRQHAFGFSFDCLVKPGWGCDLPCDYLPAAWQDWKASLADSGSMDDFNKRYPNNSRCKP